MSSLTHLLYNNITLYNNKMSLFGRLRNHGDGKYLVRIGNYDGHYIFSEEDILEVSTVNSIMIKIKDF